LRRRYIFIAVLGIIALSLLSCGRKAPPFLPERTMALRVDHLDARLEAGAVVLRGNIVPYKEKENAHIIGARLYHIRYSFDDRPCEGCPIKFAGYRDIKGDRISKDAFYLEVPGTRKAGIHYFSVCLLGQNKAVGPISERVTLSIND